MKRRSQVPPSPAKPRRHAPLQRGKSPVGEDVIRTLDRLCKYYEKYEPSSPLPLLLMRAKRLASMSFLDIIKDLSPDALTQARAVGGFDDGSGSDSQE